MSAAGLITIKRRIKSVTNTHKITKAMGLVATSKLRKSREKLGVNLKYSEAFDVIMNSVFLNNRKRNIYQTRNDSNKKLYISLTSEAGLCGGYNATVNNETIEAIKKDQENSQLMIVGQKGKVFFKKHQYNTVAEYVDIPDVPGPNDTKAIVAQALSMYRNGDIGEIHVVVTKFISQVRQIVEIEKLLPLPYYEEEPLVNDYILFEPQPNEILDGIVESYMKEKMLNFMLNSKCSEQASRMTAMDGATKNANELLEKLKLQYNRIRQGAITQEISEIVGGAEAQK
jgi:F-type H+-transporting ATPase subunit gamma